MKSKPTGYDRMQPFGVDDQPIGGLIRRRARLDQQSDHCSLHLLRPVKWVNAKSLSLEIRGNRGLGEWSRASALAPIPGDEHDDY